MNYNVTMSSFLKVVSLNWCVIFFLLIWLCISAVAVALGKQAIWPYRAYSSIVILS